jgi:hypothetical protein
METKFAGFIISVFSLLNIFKQVKAILLKSRKKIFNAFKVYVGIYFSVESGSLFHQSIKLSKLLVKRVLQVNTKRNII